MASSDTPGFPDVSALPTRARILETARRLIHVQGYEATGIAQILKEAKVRSGSFYFFFKSKDELLLEVLRTYKDMLWGEVMEPAASTAKDPIERIFAVLDGYRVMLTMFKFKLGCPIGNLALEVSESVKGARKLINENLDLWKQAITGWLTEARDRFPEGTNLPDLAAFVLTVMEGGILTARARADIEPYDRSVNSLREHFVQLSNTKGRGHAKKTAAALRRAPASRNRANHAERRRGKGSG